MYVEDMNLEQYPTKAFQDPDGNNYTTPRPATHCWKVDYMNKHGYAKWEFWKGEISSACAELSPESIRTLEKRMDSPVKITGVRFGMIYHQEEPGGPFVKIDLKDKDPRASIFYEGNYTTEYMEKWRPRAYEGYFDELKLTRGYSKEYKQAQDLQAAKKQLEQLQAALAIEKQNNDILKKQVNVAGVK